MKKMKIEKQLIFADHVQLVTSLGVSEGLTYKHEDDGIRAMGPLFIKGEYRGDHGLESFSETLEMDVLAPNEKLGVESFYLHIEEYEAIPDEDGITIYITLSIHGLKEDQSNQVEAISVPTYEPLDIPPLPTPAYEKPVMKAEPKKESKTKKTLKEVEPVEEAVIARTAIDDFDDLFEDAESVYTSYRIVVAKVNDTYSGIANRYDVDEVALRDTNKNKDIIAKTLVILPFAQN